MFVSPAFAQAADVAAQQPPFGTSLIPFVLVIAIFYFLMIRPQQKRYKEHKSMLEAVSRGDKIVTGGGVVGKVTKIEDDFVSVEIAEGTTIQVVRSTISNVIDSKAQKAKESAEKSKKIAKETTKKKIANDN